MSDARQPSEAALRQSMFGDLAPLIPPEALMHDGPPTYAAYKQGAEEFLRVYIDLCELKPHERMLDVGCGIGRKTYLLTQYLNSQGAYDGLDIVPAGIDFCTREITSRYPNFRFHLSDIFNTHYNPRGTKRAADYRFPFPDESFDFIALGSVFTHMRTTDVEHYLTEVRRVLKKDGRCLITWFLLNAESVRLINARKSTLSFVYPMDGICWTANPTIPECALAYDERHVLRQYEQKRLRIKDAIHYGSWCGREKFHSYQDMILAVPH